MELIRLFFAGISGIVIGITIGYIIRSNKRIVK